MTTTCTPVQRETLQSAKKSLLGGEALPLFLLAGYWLLCLCVITIGGDFPLNDDWIYSESVINFVHTGQVRLLACAPACIFHIITGAAACKLFGLTHMVLRAVGIVWGLVGTLAVYGAVRELKLSRVAACLFALAWAANPLVVNLAFSFMTDMPALALIGLYSFLFIRGLRTSSNMTLVLAGIALAEAACVRQNFAMLALPNAAVLIGLWLMRRGSWTVLFALVILPIVAGVAADKWMLSSNDFPELYLWYKGRAVDTVKELLHAPAKCLVPMGQTAGSVLSYIGLFALPILAPFVARLSLLLGRRPQIRPVWTALSAAFVSYTMALFISAGRLMPFNQNLLRMPHVGAHTILGINYVGLPAKVRSTLTGVSAFFGALCGALLADGFVRTLLLLGRTVRRQRQQRRLDAIGFRSCSRSRHAASRPLVCLLLFSVFIAQFGCVVVQSSFNDIDRYYVFPFLSALLCLALVWKWMKIKPTLVLTVPIIVLYSWYAIASCQDMMAWNKARWEGLFALEQQGVSPKEIDGGAEYNYFRQPQLFKNMIIHPTWYEFTHKGEPPRDSWRWWTVDKENYIVSFSPVPGYQTISTRKYWSMLSLREREILVLKKEAR